jgi:phospho-N-acetylmuramoyl-pentapeptide-transferase
MLFTGILYAGWRKQCRQSDGWHGWFGCRNIISGIDTFYFFAITQSAMTIAGFHWPFWDRLWLICDYNVYPAKIFMGDTGSLPLGALLATMAILLKQEVLLVLIGGVFVYETLCVIIQIGSVKLRKKRVFKYTPIHYSFVLSGWKEVRVVHFSGCLVSYSP